MHTRLKKIGVSLLLSGIMLALIAVGCKNDISGPGGDEANLITNPSFEPGDYPTYAGWNLNDSIFDSLQHFSNDVPILGGNWSLKLVPEFSPEEGWADYYVVGPADRYVYRLSVWAKTVGDWDGGSVQFLLRSPGASELRQYTPVNVESWQYYSLEDTVRLYDDDTLVVRLSAGTGNPDGNDAVLFDEVSLERYK